ncbi:MAG TPA: AbrB/MazE/SpoVT family DNA-binding domain-containing protein [Acidimicrobiales bacterium]
MSTVQFRVSNRGQMALPAEARRRWGLSEGGAVEIADLGHALLIVPAGRGGLRALLRASVDEAGGYGGLAAEVAADEPDLA